MSFFNWLTIYIALGGCFTLLVVHGIDLDKEIDAYFNGMINPRFVKRAFVVVSCLLWPFLLMQAINIIITRKKDEKNSAQ